MAAINYPDYLPCFLRENYEISYTPDIQRTQMATGRARMRRIYEETNGFTTVSLLLNDSQDQLFEMWYLYEIESAAWFNAKLKTPIGYSMIECRIVSRPSKKLVGNMWKLAINLEIRNEQILEGE